MEVTLLSSVEIRYRGSVLPAGPPRQRCTLAALAVSPNQPVALDTLADRVWGSQRPNDTAGTLYTHISRLRKAVRDGGGGDVLAVHTSGGGYVLQIEPERVDLHRARGLIAQARSARASGAGNLERAAQLLQTASTLWQATPLAGLYGDWVERTRHALEQERLAMLTDLLAVEVQCGRYHAALGPLADLHASNRLNELLAGLLMQALYHAGRQAEALAVYTRTRERMVEEIGDEPGAPLREIHELILRRELPRGLLYPEPPGGDEIDVRTRMLLWFVKLGIKIIPAGRE